MERGNTSHIVFPYFFYGVMSLLVMLSYLPTFSGGFILDDRPLIKNNPYITQPQSIISYLSQEDGVAEQLDPGESRTGYYRPLVNLTYWIDYRLWGVRGSGFRTTNLVLHLLTCFLLYHVIILVTGHKDLAFCMATIFALHPVNTESVSWITSRNNMLVTLFGLASFYLFVLSSEGKDAGSRFLSLIFFAGALLSKEFALVLLPIFFLWKRLFRGGREGISFQEIACYLPFFFVLIAYLFLRYNIAGLMTSAPETASLWKRVYFAPYLLLLNLGLILFPFKLHSFIIQYPSSPLVWEGFLGFVFSIVLGLFIWRVRRNKLLCFSMISFVIALLPVLNIIPISSASLISMRWLYFPMTFLILGVSSYIRGFLESKNFLTVSILSLISLYFGVYSHALNRDLWHDEETFFNQEVRRFDNLYYATGLAEILLEKKDHEESERYFMIAIENNSAVAKDHINYAALLLDTGRSDKALLILNRAKRMKMTYRERGEFHNNVGIASFNLNRFDEAILHLKKAVVFSPDEPQFWSNLGGAYGTMGDYQNSEHAFRRGLEAAFDSIGLRNGLALTYIKMKDYEQAVSVLQQIPPQERMKDRETMRLLAEAREKLRLTGYPDRGNTNGHSAGQVF